MQKGIFSKAVQNGVVFFLIVIGLVLGLIGMYIAWFLILLGLILGLFFIIKRSMSRRPRRVSVLAISLFLCWVYVLSSPLLMAALPNIYGQDLGGLFAWFATVLNVGIAVTVLTSIELFRTSKQ